MTLLYTRDGAIGWITLSNPPWNALTDPVFGDAAELEAFLHAPDLKAVIVKGEGRHFSSGADVESLKALHAEPARFRERMERGRALLEALAYAPVPALAAVRGSCLGAGLEIALACHFRFASPNAMLGFPEVEHGIMPGFGAAARLPGLAARSTAVELVLSGRMLRADEALPLGLVDRVVPPDNLEPAALEFLHALTARRSPGLIRSVMTALHNGRRLPLDEALRRETELFFRVVRGDG